jgi:hypothetical protein
LIARSKAPFFLSLAEAEAQNSLLCCNCLSLLDRGFCGQTPLNKPVGITPLSGRDEVTP